MLKKVVLLSLMFCLCSCEIFGWDSSGGIDGDVNKNPAIDIGENVEITNTFYIDIPMGYPNAGTEAPTESMGSFQIQIPNLESQPRSIVISQENALILTKAACDQTAATILNVNVGADETLVFWQNDSMSMGSLSLTNVASGDPALQTITCIN